MLLRYAIIGSGAVGGYYGGMLAKAGKDVHFLFNSDYCYVKSHGLQVDSVKGNFKVFPIQCYQSSEDMPKCDVVLVCLKSTNNKILKNILPPILHNNTLVILIQNGLGIECDLQKDFPNLNIAGAMAFICSNKIGKGHIAHLDEGALSIGSYSCNNIQLLYKVNKEFLESGIDSQIVELVEARWKKLIWNIPYNGMTVILNTDTAGLMKNINSRKIIKNLMLEVIEAANHVGKRGFYIDEALVDRMMTTTEQMKPYLPSMKLDFDNHRPLEIEYIYTQPILEAAKCGYEMRCVSMLEKQLRFIESSYNNVPLGQL